MEIDFISSIQETSSGGHDNMSGRRYAFYVVGSNGARCQGTRPAPGWD